MISKNNIWLYGASGKAGNMVVKNYSGKIVISARPDMSRRVLSEKQKEFNELMKYANEWAKKVMLNPKQKEEACLTLRVPANKVFRAMVKEFILRKGDVDDILPSYVSQKYKNNGINHEHFINTESPVNEGKPVIKGTDIPIEVVLQKLSRGTTFPELLEEYPRLKMEDILAVLAYASERVSGNR